MRKRARWMLALLAAVCVTPLVGCNGAAKLRLIIPDFTTAGVKGVRLWERDPQTGDFVSLSTYELGAVTKIDGTEYVEFNIVDDRFELGVPLASEVMRDPTNPEAVILDLVVVTLGETISVRASTYNDTGDSNLSDTEVVLASS